MLKDFRKINIIYWASNVVIDRASVTLLLIFIGAHVFILNKIIFFPYPELFIYSYLTNKGLLPYKDIFDQHFPGIMLSPINMISLGFDTPYEARLLHMVLIAVNHILIYLLAKKIFRSNFLSLCANFFYLIWQPYMEGYVLWIESFVTPLILLAANIFSVKYNFVKKYFFSGLVLGVAFIFKQVLTFLLFFLAAYIIVKHGFKKGLIFVLGVSLPVILMLFYIIKKGVFPEFFFWTFIFNVTTFAEMGRKYPTVYELLKGLWVFGPSFVVILWAKLKNRLEESYVVLFIFLLGSLAFAYARFDWVHLQPALPFAILFFILFLKIFHRYVVYLFVPLYIIGSAYLIMPFYNWAFSQKNIQFFGDFENKLKDEVIKYVQPDDSVFAFGTTPHLYFLTNTLPAGRVFVFQFPWFMKISEERVLEGIISNQPKVVVRDKTAQVQGMNLLESMPDISNYIERNFKVVGLIDGVEIMIPL